MSNGKVNFPFVLYPIYGHIYCSFHFPNIQPAALAERGGMGLYEGAATGIGQKICLRQLC